MTVGIEDVEVPLAKKAEILIDSDTQVADVEKQYPPRSDHRGGALSARSSKIWQTATKQTTEAVQEQSEPATARWR